MDTRANLSIAAGGTVATRRKFPLTGSDRAAFADLTMIGLAMLRPLPLFS